MLGNGKSLGHSNEKMLVYPCQTRSSELNFCFPSDTALTDHYGPYASPSD